MTLKRVFARGSAAALSTITISSVFLLIGCAGSSASDGIAPGRGSGPSSSVEADVVTQQATGSVLAALPIPSTSEPATLRLTSKSGGTAVPFSVGYAFRQGHVPQGKFVAASGQKLKSFQATVKNRWRDGSVKFAVLSGVIDLPASSEQNLVIGPTDSNSAGAPLDLAALKATGVSASIGYGSYGTASWANDGWDSPFLASDSGSEMSSWVYRQAIGGDQHLVAWIEVRLYRGGAVEIVPWIENGYLLRPSPGVRSGMAAFSFNGNVRFSGEITLFNHTRAVLANGQTLSHWAGSDPEVSFRHDMGYLQSTGLVPAYRAITSGDSSVFSRLTTSYTPLAQHDYPAAMGTAGYHPSIGPLPEWDVAYITSDGDPRAWRAVQVNGYAAGRYGYHFRDENTNRAPLLSSHPNLVLSEGSGIAGTGASSKNSYTPATSGGSGPNFTSSHMPSIGFMAYLVTGRWYFLDEIQLLVSTMLLKQTDTTRNSDQGLILASAGANTTRGAGWTLRALAHAAVMTPDTDEALRSALISNVESNIDSYYAFYVGQTNNPLGLVQPYSDYTPGDGKIDSAAWMEDFLTWAFGNIKSLQAYRPAYDAKLDAFLAWKYRSIVGRLGPNSPGNWSYRNAAAYTVPYAPSETPGWADGSGPWYASWGDAYGAAGLTYTAGDSLLGAYIEDDGLATSYWGNLQPALAYAVEHGAEGALASYDRMVGASNWAAAATHFNKDTPVWSVRPRNVAY